VDGETAWYFSKIPEITSHVKKQAGYFTIVGNVTGDMETD
jgi:hypothetical protein